MEHIAQEKIEAYAQHRLDAGELLTVADHFGECDNCRLRLEDSMNSDASFFAIRSEVFGDSISAHLTTEGMAGYVDKKLAGEEFQMALDHLANCERCSLEVNDLETFRKEIASSVDREFRPSGSPSTESWWRRATNFLPDVFRTSPVPAFGAAFAILLVALIGWLVLRTQWDKGAKQEAVVLPAPPSQPSLAPNQQPTATEIQPAPSVAVAQLKDGEGSLTLDDKGKLSGADNLPAAYQDRLRKAITTQRVERSSQLEGLTRPPSALMSSDKQADGFSVLDPAGDVLITTQPTFRWTSMPAATGYVVEIYDDKFQLVMSSPELTDHSWTARQSLERGKVYSWQVKAIKDGEETISPRPPAPQAKFRVLDQSNANEIAKAKRAYGSSHLSLALLYAESGLLKEAEQELRQLQKANPDSELVRKLLRQVQALRRRE